MNQAELQSDPLREYAQQYCSGTLSAEQTAALEERLRDDPRAMEFFVLYMEIHSQIAWEARALGEQAKEGKEERGEGRGLGTSEPVTAGSDQDSGFRVQDSDSAGLASSLIPDPSEFIIQSFPFLFSPLSPLPSFVGSILFSYLMATVIFGIGLVVGALVRVSDPVQVARQSAPLPSHLSLPPSIVGQITGMVDCRFDQRSEISDPKTEDRRPKTLVSLGDKFALASGLMEITYDTGAKVILQGPVTYEAESRAGGYLSVGKLTAKLEKASGFRVQDSEISKSPSPKTQDPRPKTQDLFVIRTPTATVTDLGTEFGVEVRDSGITSAHVFRGRVEVRMAARDGQQGQAIRLSENESVQVKQQSGGGVAAVQRGTADPAAFVRVEQLPRLAEQRRLGPFRRWQAYSERLRKDPSLLAYYDFQQRSDGYLGVLRNSAAGGDESRDGAIGNALWASGRMPGKQSLQFRGPNDYVRINLPQKTDDLTIAAWVFLDVLPNEYSSLLSSDTFFTAGATGQVSWLLGADRRVSFNVLGTGEAAYRSSPVFDQSRLCRWTHLAVVWDHAAALVRFYLDGQMTDEARIRKRILTDIGPAAIGHWMPNGGYSGKPRNLQGRIDEFAIFGRPLTSNEIQRMFEAGKPEQSATPINGE